MGRAPGWGDGAAGDSSVRAQPGSAAPGVGRARLPTRPTQPWAAAHPAPSTQHRRGGQQLGLEGDRPPRTHSPLRLRLWRVPDLQAARGYIKSMSPEAPPPAQGAIQNLPHGSLGSVGRGPLSHCRGRPGRDMRECVHTQAFPAPSRRTRCTCVCACAHTYVQRRHPHLNAQSLEKPRAVDVPGRDGHRPEVTLLAGQRCHLSKDPARLAAGPTHPTHPTASGEAAGQSPSPP